MFLTEEYRDAVWHVNCVIKISKFLRFFVRGGKKGIANRFYKEETMKKVFAVLLILVMMFTIAACGTEEEGTPDVRTIQIGTPNAADETDPYYMSAVYIQEYVEEHGDGSLKIEVFPNSTLGGESEMFEGMQTGTVDMAVINNSCATNYIPECGLLDLPFILPDYETAKAIFTGEMKDTLLGFYEGSGVKSLGLAIGGFRIPGTTDTSIYSPEDLEGLKMRCVENQIYMNTYKAFGANALPMAFSEVLTGLQQGTIDGTDLGASVFWTSGFADVIGSISVTNQFCAVLSVDISQSLWDELTEEQQTLLTTAAEEACAKALDDQEANDAEKLELLADAGVEIIPTEEVDIQAFKDCLTDFYDSYMDQIGQDNYDSLVAAVERITSAG